MSGNQGKMPSAGPYGRNLIANVERLRRPRGLSYRKLAAAMEEAGRPLPAIGISRMMAGERRVDVDELVALAAVLRVTPDHLLLPPEAAADAQAEAPAALRAVGNLGTRIEQLLAASGDRTDCEALSGYVDRALRRVQIEVEELLAEGRQGGGDRP